MDIEEGKITFGSYDISDLYDYDVKEVYGSACAAAKGRLVNLETGFFAGSSACYCKKLIINPYFNDCNRGKPVFVGDVGRVPNSSKVERDRPASTSVEN